MNFFLEHCFLQFLCTAVCMYKIDLHSAVHRIEPMAKKKNSAAVALGRKGGTRSRVNLTPEKRTVLAKKAAAARCKATPKVDGDPPPTPGPQRGEGASAPPLGEKRPALAKRPRGRRRDKHLRPDLSPNVLHSHGLRHLRQQPDILHKPTGTRGACYCPDCCPACSEKKPKDL